MEEGDYKAWYEHRDQSRNQESAETTEMTLLNGPGWAEGEGLLLTAIRLASVVESVNYGMSSFCREDLLHDSLQCKDLDSISKSTISI